MSQTGDKPVTQLLHRWRGGDRQALDRLIPLVETELRRLAGRFMGGERRDHTLQTTALVNEVYLRLVDVEVSWQDRAHFFAVAARLMRRILVDKARERRSAKRGGGEARLELDEALAAADERPADLVALDDALTALAEQDARKAQVIELHYFGGMTYDEIAEALQLSAVTVHRDLKMAKAWLYRELRSERAGD